MKKAFFRLMGLVLGLSVFTACYGPAPGGWPYDDAEQPDTQDTNPPSDTKADDGTVVAVEEAPEAAAEPAQ